MANEKKTKKVYRDGLGEIKNPVSSVVGKVVIWTLIIFTAAAPIAGLIALLVELGK